MRLLKLSYRLDAYLCKMILAAWRNSAFNHFLARNSIALTGLLLAIYLPDYRAIDLRSDWDKLTPYLFAVLLYAWLVFHNRILYKRLLLRGRQREYFFWTLLLIASSSLNITLALRYIYHTDWPVPMLVKFYVFTFTGFATYVAYQQFMIPKSQIRPIHVAAATTLTIIVDGKKSEIESDNILYIESLENYIRVFTIKEQLIARMTTKEAAQQLPEQFIRINRSCLINTRFVTNWKADEIIINETRLKIGRTYKQYVIEHLKSQTI